MFYIATLDIENLYHDASIITDSVKMMNADMLIELDELTINDVTIYVVRALETSTHSHEIFEEHVEAKESESLYKSAFMCAFFDSESAYKLATDLVKRRNDNDTQETIQSAVELVRKLVSSTDKFELAMLHESDSTSIEDTRLFNVLVTDFVANSIKI